MFRGCLIIETNAAYQTSDMPWKRDIDEVFGVPSMADMMQAWVNDQRLD
jgi:hypothetical protein